MGFDYSPLSLTETVNHCGNSGDAIAMLEMTLRLKSNSVPCWWEALASVLSIPLIFSERASFAGCLISDVRGGCVVGDREYFRTNTVFNESWQRHLLDGSGAFASRDAGGLGTPPCAAAATAEAQLCFIRKPMAEGDQLNAARSLAVPNLTDPVSPD